MASKAIGLRRVDVKQRSAPQRLGALGQFDQFGDVGGAGMAGRTLVEPCAIALGQNLAGRMAPDLGGLLDAGAAQVILEHLARLEAEPGIDDKNGARRGLADDDQMAW